MKYDLVIIGGGPSGLMAALQATEAGAKVLLLEKNYRLGVKLLVTGGGRCNITNNIPDYHLLAQNFDEGAKFLLSTFSRFGVLETMAFFESRGLKLKTENDNKVFPASDKGADILKVFIEGIKDGGGKIRTNSIVSDLEIVDQKIIKLILDGGEEILADNFLIATGGLSYPATGSSGDGLKWLKKIGHHVINTRPALAPLIVSEEFVKNLEGLSLENVVLNLYCENKKIAQEKGSVIFTARGLSGPAALNISRYVDFGSSKNWRLEVDLQLDFSKEELDKKLISLFATSNKFLKNNLENLLPTRLAETILLLSKINPERAANSLSRAERQILVETIKSFQLNVLRVEGYDRAMVTVGGVDLKEINPKTMRSKLISNLFLAGEILNIAGPTGGYNLQAAWSTGFAVGNAINAEK